MTAIRAITPPAVDSASMPQQHRRRDCLRLGLAGLAVAAGASSIAPAHADEPVSASRFGSVAIGGHDPAAYHALARRPRAQAVSGAKAHTVSWKGADWRFADADSAARFQAEPERYAPAYNGHCANALSLGEGLIRTDGTHWQIFEGDDRLYLFYAARGRTRWLDGDREAYRAQADAAWQRLSR